MSSPPRPAPTRTYGRRRHESPEAGPSLFTKATETAQPGPSPAKSLLNKFGALNASWLTGLLSNDQTISSTKPSTSQSTEVDDDDNDEPDPEELAAMAAKLRKQARGGLDGLPDPILLAAEDDARRKEARKAINRLAPPQNNKLNNALFGSSSLTEIPSDAARNASSPPASSPLPPQAPAAEIISIVTSSSQRATSPEIETIPIRKSGLHRSSNRRRIAESSDDDENADRPAPVSTRQKVVTPPLSPSPALSAVDRSSRASTPPTPPSPKKRNVQSVDEFMNSLAGGSDSEKDEEEGRKAGKASSDIIDGGSPLPDGKGKKVKVKPLNKKEHEQMRRDLAEAGRQRVLAISKPEPNRLPMSSFFKDADAALRSFREETNNAVPDLTHGRSPPTSDPHITPADPIITFSSSTRDKDSKLTTGSPSSSPTPKVPVSRNRTIVPSTSEIIDIDEDLSLPDRTIEDFFTLPEDPEILKKQRAAKLLKIKQLALASKPPRRMIDSDDSDDDFCILPDEPKAKSAGPAARRGPNAQAVLNRPTGTSAISKSRQDNLRLAGKSTKAKEDTTETYIKHAGKTWDHAGSKTANGGVKAAGQKPGRERPLTQAEVDAKMKEAHAIQAARLMKKKDADFGRKRMIPEKQSVDLSEAIARFGEREHVKDEVEDDENKDDGEDDSEDGDFKLDDEDDEDDEVMYSGEEDVPIGSGDEDEGHDDIVSNAGGESNKENEGTMEDEEEAFVPSRPVRKPRASHRIVDSDDEEETPKRPASMARAPLAEVVVPQESTPRALEQPAFDLAGFGNGSPGFSQLFDATQAADESTAEDGLAKLRDAPFGAFLPTQALLPQNEISETQAERDNLLIAGEGADEMESLPGMIDKPKPRYLNSQGLFTQTKPAAYEPMEGIDESPVSHRQSLKSSESLSLDATTTSPIPTSFSATERSPQRESLSVEGAIPLSPTQEGSPRLSRLRRRDSADESMEPEPTQMSSPSPTKAKQPRDALSALMDNSRRQQARDERKLKNKQKRSKLVEGEAEESDEDNGWMGNSGDEAEDEEDDNGFLEELVDDQKVSEEEEKRQKELADVKRREIEQEDEAKRLAEAQDVADGKHRVKRRGVDFFSDEEDEDGKPRRLSKKQRRKRDLGREDGLDKLDGEENVFKRAYEDDLGSDSDDDIEDHIAVDSPRKVASSPGAAAPKISHREAMKLLKERARANYDKDLDQEDEDVDLDIGFKHGGFTGDITEDVFEEESQFSVSRNRRVIATSTSVEQMSVARYQSYVESESQVTRRQFGSTAASVVMHTSNKRAIPAISKNNSLQSRRSTNSSVSVLQSKTSRFG